MGHRDCQEAVEKIHRELHHDEVCQACENGRCHICDLRITEPRDGICASCQQPLNEMLGRIHFHMMRYRAAAKEPK